MKSRYIFCLVSVILCFTSCQTINNVLGKRAVNNTTVTKKKTDRKPVKIFQIKKRGKKVSSQNDENQTENNVSDSISKVRTFTEADRLRASRRLAGEWYFDTVGGIAVSGETNRPTLEFDENSTRFYANNGCNYFNGNYSIENFNDIKLENVISTLQDCSGPAWESLISDMWSKIEHWDYHGGAEKQLIFKNSEGKILATLKRHALENFNGLWQVAEINGHEPDGEPLVMVIDLRECHVHGNTGCNLFNGTIYQDPDSEGSVQFQDMSVSKKNCDNSANETAFLVALEQVEHVKLQGQDTAILYDIMNREILKLKKSDY